jgi:ketosteroid isomerase-like protein
MKKVLLLLLSILFIEAHSQDYRQEINDQVWVPFIKTFNDYDAAGFLALHSKDLVRSSRDSKTILTWEEYLRQQCRGDDQAKADNSKRTLELRFTEHIANATQAIEVGIYKTTNTNSKGESRSFYGRFHVVLRKENGGWKILVDTDSSEGDTIGEKDFLDAAPLIPLAK